MERSEHRVWWAAVVVDLVDRLVTESVWSVLSKRDTAKRGRPTFQPPPGARRKS
jgi:hypothetical protein